MTEKNAMVQFSDGRRWLSFLIVLALSILGSMVMFKASPVFPELMADSDLGFDAGNIGLMMSMYSIIGIVLAFPVGGILMKIGYKKSLYIVAGSLVVGGAMGALAVDSTMLLASRVIEGIANGFIAVICSASVAALLPQKNQGLGMGLASAWFPAGAIISLNLAPALVSGIGWRGIWWVMVALAVVLFVLTAVCFKLPPSQASAADEGPSVTQAAKAKPMWASIILTSVLMCSFGFVFGGAEGSFYPTFLQDAHGLDSQTAGTLTSIVNVMNVVFGPIAGAIADRLKTQKGLMVVGAAIMVVLYTFAFSDNLSLVYVFIGIMGIANALMATGIYSIIPILAKDPAKIGLGMSCVAFFQNLGIVAASSLFGGYAVSVGWNMACLTMLLPVAAVGLVAAALVRTPKKVQE